MENRLKREVYDYLLHGGSVEKRKKLIDEMYTELNYIDLENMAVCTDDAGCANLTMEQLEKVADKLEDRLMEEFNSNLYDVLNELGY